MGTWLICMSEGQDPRWALRQDEATEKLTAGDTELLNPESSAASAATEKETASDTSERFVSFISICEAISRSCQKDGGPPRLTVNRRPLLSQYHTSMSSVSLLPD